MVHNFRVSTELPYQGKLVQSFRDQFIPFPSAVAQQNQQLPYPRHITHNTFLGGPHSFWLTSGHYTVPVQSYTMSSSSMLDDGPPEKKFRIDVSDKEVKVDVESSLSPDTTITSMTAGSLEGQPLTGESVDGQSPAGPSSARSSNASVVSTGSAEKDDDSDMGMTGNLLEMISKSLLGNVFKTEDSVSDRRSLSPLTNGSNPGSTIPGALAVSQTPAAQLFAEMRFLQDDWSWHRNPAASIRSGGTNKQTPVWKYFVYNKAENISRCIIGDCTYILKGPHTSTLACHLKKHPDEYAEFQKLKVDYTRERHGGNQPGSPTAPQMVPPTQNMIHKVPKKKERDMNNFVSALRGQQSQSVQPGSPLPNIMQNLLAMNPLQFMLNPQMNTPTSSAPSINNNAHATASHMLQQAGLTMSNNGQIVQSKKWRRDERRQRELESRMSLAMAVSHTETDAVSLQMWREMLEVAQPKFYFPEEHTVFEQMVCSHLNRMQQSIKSQLAQTRRICLSVETVRIPPISGVFDETINRITVTATFPGYSTPRYELQSVLLASRPLIPAESAAEAVKTTVEQILSEYDVSMDKVSRVVWSGLKDSESDETVFEKTMEPFAERLISCFNTFVDQSSQVDELRKSVINLIFGFISKAETLTALNKATGGNVELPLSESFPILAEAVIKIRDVIQMLYEQGLLIGNLNEQQWRLLHGFCTVSQLFKQCIWGDVHSVDAAIPSVKQLLMSLEKDQHAQFFYTELHELICDKMRSITDVNDENFDGTYIQATALNPQLAVLLDDTQLQYAKKSLENILKKRLPLLRSSSANGVDALLASVLQQQQKMANQEGVNPIYADILQQAQERINQDRSPSKEKMAESIINAYFDEILSGCSVEALLSPFASRSFGNPFQPPLQFWLQAANHSSQLSEMATELLSVPASCPSLARLLSRRSRESPWSNKDFSLVFANLDHPEKLERDVMLRYNRNLLPKTY